MLTVKYGRSKFHAIREYGEAIWHVKPVKVGLEKYIHRDAGLKVANRALRFLSDEEFQKVVRPETMTKPDET